MKHSCGFNVFDIPSNKNNEAKRRQILEVGVQNFSYLQLAWRYCDYFNHVVSHTIPSQSDLHIVYRFCPSLHPLFTEFTRYETHKTNTHSKILHGYTIVMWRSFMFTIASVKCSGMTNNLFFLHHFHIIILPIFFCVCQISIHCHYWVTV